ncbi:MAG: DUF4863 family protein [Planctomycetes bacterium]|nr:DUF4863 family protein [Planctomycetota bacterium]
MTMLETFRPLIDAARGLDLSQPDIARDVLADRFHPAGNEARALNSKLIELLEQGRIAERGAMPVKFGRVTKAVPESDDFSIDVVHMDGPGPHHAHPGGEVNYCIALEGEPRFDGAAPGWVVMPPGSAHVPTVTGGRMLIVYLLPGGRIEFTKT